MECHPGCHFGGCCGGALSFRQVSATFLKTGTRRWNLRVPDFEMSRSDLSSRHGTSRRRNHYSDVIMSTIASQITNITIVYSTIYSGADQRKHQSSASLAFVQGIHRWPVNSPHKGPVMRKMFPFDDVIMIAARVTYPINNMSLLLETLRTRFISFITSLPPGSSKGKCDHISRPWLYLYSNTTSYRYRQTFNIRRNKCQNLNVSLLLLWVSLPNALKPGVKSRMKM